MKKAIIVLLALAIILVNGYGILAAGKPKTELAPENLTVVAAPEQTESMEHEDFAKEEYVSVLPEGTNIALEGKIKSNGFEGTFTERKAIDGKTEGASYWEGSADSYPNELTVSFEEAHTIRAIRVALNPDSIWGKRTQTFSVFYANAEGEGNLLLPETAYEFSPDRGNEVILDFEETPVTSLTLQFTANTGALGGQVAEFEIYE